MLSLLFILSIFVSTVVRGLPVSSQTSRTDILFVRDGKETAPYTKSETLCLPGQDCPHLEMPHSDGSYATSPYARATADVEPSSSLTLNPDASRSHGTSNRDADLEDDEDDCDEEEDEEDEEEGNEGDDDEEGDNDEGDEDEGEGKDGDKMDEEDEDEEDQDEDED